MGRRRKSGREIVFQVFLRLREGEDDDLIAFFSRIPSGRRAAAVKTALRMGGIPRHPDGAAGPAEEEILEDLAGLAEGW
jgi:hypothetical protein